MRRFPSPLLSGVLGFHDVTSADLSSQTNLFFSGDNVRRYITGPPGPQGPRGQKGERGDPGYVQGYAQSQSYTHGDSRQTSDQRAFISRLTENLDYSNVALKVTDYIKSEWNIMIFVICKQPKVYVEKVNINI